MTVGSIPVHIRVVGVWRVAWAVRFATAAAWLRLIDRRRAGLWVARAAARLRAQTRIGRRGRWTDAGPIGIDRAEELLRGEMAKIEARRGAA